MRVRLVLAMAAVLAAVSACSEVEVKPPLENLGGWGGEWNIGGAGGDGGDGGTGGHGGTGGAGGIGGSGGGPIECTSPEILCDGACVDIRNDPAHCGDCRSACDEGALCGDSYCFTVTGLALGGARSCVTVGSGSVRCWGENASHPIYVGGVQDAQQVSVGRSHFCMVLEGTLVSSVWCQGENAQGQLGDGSRESTDWLVNVNGLVAEPAERIAAGSHHTCALLTTGRVACWGSNAYGQLGDGTTEDKLEAWPIDGLEGVKQISAGEFHTCALVEDDEAPVRCWGRNTHAQLTGTGGDPELRPVPVPIEGEILSLDSGARHNCVLVSEAGSTSVWCWGSEEWAKLGNTDRHGLPGKARETEGAVELSVGAEHSCALFDDGTAKCWGRNDNGQLGDGTVVGPPGRPAVVELGGIRRIAAGGDHTCAQLEDGSVHCWGRNDQRQLGRRDASRESQPLPGPVHWSAPSGI